MVVVDASVVVDWVAPGSADVAVAARLLDAWIDQGVTPIAPALLSLEVRNALLLGVRQDRWDGRQADSAQTLLAALPIDVEDSAPDIARAWDLARRYDEHPIYDMVYVALAERRSVPLVTADDRLRRRLADLDWVLTPEEAMA